MNYFDHNDSKGRALRQFIQIRHAERARMLATFEESYNGNVTLYMSALEIQTACTKAMWLGWAKFEPSKRQCDEAQARYYKQV